jgi:hypothetical protein
MAIKRWNASTSTWELVGTPGTVTPAAIGAAALVGNNILTGSLGVYAGGARVMYASNIQSLPGSDDGTSANMPFGFGGNLTGGSAEMDIFNTVNLASTSDGGKGFHFIQKTGASTYEKPLAITGNGYLYQTDILGSRETGLIRNYSTPHISTNRGATFMVGLNDGSFTGMIVGNIASGSGPYNSQYVAFNTHEGGNSVAERMRITSLGNVGIGITSPTGRMHISTGAVESGSYIPLRLTSTGTPGSPFTWSSSSMAAGMTSGMNNIHMIGQAESIRNSGYIGYRWSSSGSTSNLLTFGHFGVDNVVNIDGNGYLLSGYTSSNGAYRLQVNSQIFATSSSIATSDGRYKENVLPITSGLDIIDSLNPVSFNWKEHAVHNFPEGKTVGFIAQEVQEALSDYEWVDNIIKSNYNEEADEEFLGIAESNIIPLLVAAVKELRSELNTLKASML